MIWQTSRLEGLKTNDVTVADSSASAVLIVPVAIVLGLLILVAVIQYFVGIKSELKWLNIEIRRTHGSEQKYWKKRKRRLLWSILPFIKY